MSSPSGKGGSTTHSLLILLAMYSLANFVLFVGSLVAWKKAEGQTVDGRCNIQGISCGISAWAIYPFLAAAGLTSSFVAILMFTHGLLRTMKARLDPLYVVRGVFFTLILLVPIVVVGWSSSHYIYHDDEGEKFNLANLVDTRGNRYPHIEASPGNFGNGNMSSYRSRFVSLVAVIINRLRHDIKHGQTHKVLACKQTSLPGRFVAEFYNVPKYIIIQCQKLKRHIRS
ncbi:hypothetical protein X797_003252 [Metarhizium robertsii]|uniref:Uncharacterized protein n=1 Tax=Metarhizium robertsii TaxID=568076 RepID=A0A0A1UZM3_9HYPO|nr:hypothetical protein X797_003252 [Metarhizium robertsii]